MKQDLVRSERLPGLSNYEPCQPGRYNSGQPVLFHWLARKINLSYRSCEKCRTVLDFGLDSQTRDSDLDHGIGRPAESAGWAPHLPGSGEGSTDCSLGSIGSDLRQAVEGFIAVAGNGHGTAWTSAIGRQCEEAIACDDRRHDRSPDP